MTNICEFCNKEFANKHTLQTHKQNTKYCLVIQGERNNNYKCNTCNKNYTTKQALNKHEENCQVIYGDLLKKNQEYEQELIELRIKYNIALKRIEQLEKYEEKYIKRCDVIEDLFMENYSKDHETLRKKVTNETPRTITQYNSSTTSIKNQVIQNLVPLSKSALAETSIPKLNDQVIMSVPRMIDNARELFLGSVLCTDTSRLNIVFKDENDTIVQDQGGMQLSKLYFSIIKDASYDIIAKKISAIYMDDDKRNDKYYRDLVEKLAERRTHIQEASEVSNRLSREFVQDICKICKFVGVTPLDIKKIEE